jgi:two component transcriptional regulator, LuxR family
MSPNHADRRTVLVVDDVADNLAVLHDALHEAGYSVRVASDGSHALDSVRRAAPDIIVLDAMMPGVDGFETCRRLKAVPQSADIPVIFMTGLSDTEHILEAFRAGGVDYVTKPIVAAEVIARIDTHLRNAQLVAQTRQAVDAAGRAVLAFDAERRVIWSTPLARRWINSLLEPGERLPAPLRRWIDASQADGNPQTLWSDGQRLTFSRLDGDLLLIQRQASLSDPETLARLLGLTPREAEALYWVALGKTNREIAEILAMSPRTVNKHLEHVFEKLNVETRTAAAAIALARGSH